MGRERLNNYSPAGQLCSLVLWGSPLQLPSYCSLLPCPFRHRPILAPPQSHPYFCPHFQNSSLKIIPFALRAHHILWAA